MNGAHCYFFGGHSSVDQSSSKAIVANVTGVGGRSIGSFANEARNSSVGLSCNSAWNTTDSCSDGSDI